MLTLDKNLLHELPKGNSKNTSQTASNICPSKNYPIPPKNKNKIKNLCNTDYLSLVYQSPVLGCLLMEGTSKVGAKCIPL